MKPKKLSVFYNGREVFSGSLGTDRIFRKQVQTRQQLFKFRAYGLDAENVEELKLFKCKGIELYEKDTGNRYRIDFETFLSKAFRDRSGRFGVRYYLPLKNWHKNGVNPNVWAAPQPTPTAAVEDPQLSLFDCVVGACS